MAKEEELVNFLDVHSNIEYPYTRKYAIANSKEVVDGKGMNVQGNKWTMEILFLSLNVILLYITLRTTIPLSIARVAADDSHEFLLFL